MVHIVKRWFMNIDEYTAKLLSAVGQENRIRIIKFLAGGEKCVCEIFPALGIEQSNLSKHLRVLTDAGILESRKEGLSVYYRIIDIRVLDILELADKIKRSEIKKLSELIN